MPGVCGCGVSDVDTDGDGMLDCHDTCDEVSKDDSKFLDLRVSWGTTPISSKGGEYRICWCAAGFSCSIPEEHIIDMGELTLIGPSPLVQDRTCISGQSCRPDGFTGHYLSGSHHKDKTTVLSGSDHFWILDTCGQHTYQGTGVLPRMSYTDHETTTKLLTSGASMLWQDSPITAQGGKYRLCWCAGSSLEGTNTSVTSSADRVPGSAADSVPKAQDINASVALIGFSCSMTESFRVDLGTFTLIGPRPLNQDRTCMSGQTCQFDGVYGHLTSQTDRFFILDTCGVESTLPRMPKEGRLCDMSRYVNTVNYTGSTSNETDDCTETMMFSGYCDSDPDSNATTACTGNATSLTKMLPVALNSTTLRLGFGKDFVTAAGGQYRLCWCTSAGWLDTSKFHCSIASDFRVDVGKFELIGPRYPRNFDDQGRRQQRPNFHEDRTCVSGQTCSLDGILGHHLDAGDRFLVVDTCGERSQIPRFGPSGLLPSVTASGAAVDFEALTLTAAGQYMDKLLQRFM